MMLKGGCAVFLSVPRTVSTACSSLHACLSDLDDEEESLPDDVIDQTPLPQLSISTHAPVETDPDQTPLLSPVLSTPLTGVSLSDLRPLHVDPSDTEQLEDEDAENEEDDVPEEEYGDDVPEAEEEREVDESFQQEDDRKASADEFAQLHEEKPQEEKGVATTNGARDEAEVEAGSQPVDHVDCSDDLPPHDDDPNIVIVDDADDVNMLSDDEEDSAPALDRIVITRDLLVARSSLGSIERTESASLDSEDLEESYGEAQLLEMEAEMQRDIAPSPLPPPLDEGAAIFALPPAVEDLMHVPHSPAAASDDVMSGSYDLASGTCVLTSQEAAALESDVGRLLSATDERTASVSSSDLEPVSPMTFEASAPAVQEVDGAQKEVEAIENDYDVEVDNALADGLNSDEQQSVQNGPTEVHEDYVDHDFIQTTADNVETEEKEVKEDEEDELPKAVTPCEAAEVEPEVGACAQRFDAPDDDDVSDAEFSRDDEAEPELVELTSDSELDPDDRCDAPELATRSASASASPRPESPEPTFDDEEAKFEAELEEHASAFVGDVISDAKRSLLEEEDQTVTTVDGFPCDDVITQDKERELEGPRQEDEEVVEEEPEKPEEESGNLIDFGDNEEKEATVQVGELAPEVEFLTTRNSLEMVSPESSVDSFATVVAANDDAPACYDAPPQWAQPLPVLTAPDAVAPHPELQRESSLEARAGSQSPVLERIQEGEEEAVGDEEEEAEQEVEVYRDQMELSVIQEESDEEKRKSTSSSDRLDVASSCSSERIASSPDAPHFAVATAFAPHMRGKSGEMDDISVSSSLLEFEQLEAVLEKHSPESTLRTRSTASASEAAEGESDLERRSGQSSNSSLNEFERLEREAIVDEELEKEARKVVSLLESGALVQEGYERHFSAALSTAPIADEPCIHEDTPAEVETGERRESLEKDAELRPCEGEEDDESAPGDSDSTRELDSVVCVDSDSVDNDQTLPELNVDLTGDDMQRSVDADSLFSTEEAMLRSVDSLTEQTLVQPTPEVETCDVTAQCLEVECGENLMERSVDSLEAGACVKRSGSLDSLEYDCMIKSADSLDAPVIPPPEVDVDAAALVTSTDSLEPEVAENRTVYVDDALIEPEYDDPSDDVPQEPLVCFSDDMTSHAEIAGLADVMTESADSLELQQMTSHREEVIASDDDESQNAEASTLQDASLICDVTGDMAMSVDSSGVSESSSVVSADTLKSIDECRRDDVSDDAMAMSCDSHDDLLDSPPSELDAPARTPTHADIYEQEERSDNRRRTSSRDRRRLVSDDNLNFESRSDATTSHRSTSSVMSYDTPSTCSTYLEEERGGTKAMTYEPGVGKIAYSADASMGRAWMSRETVTSIVFEPDASHSSVTERIPSPHSRSSTPTDSSAHSDNCYCGPSREQTPLSSPLHRGTIASHASAGLASRYV